MSKAANHIEIILIKLRYAFCGLSKKEINSFVKFIEMMAEEIKTEKSVAGQFELNKQAILKEWENRRASLKPTHKFDDGNPDPDILPLVDFLNTLPGVVTLQSCEGHKKGDFKSSGHIWLNLSPRMSRKFEEATFELVRENRLIERVGKIYNPDKSETIIIKFAGNERNTLAESMGHLKAFFINLCESNN